MFRSNVDEIGCNAMYAVQRIEIARPRRCVRTNRVEWLEGGATGPFGFEMTDCRFGIGPAAHDDVLQVRAERNFDSGFVASREFDQLSNGSFDAGQLAGLHGRQHFAYPGIQPGAAFLNAFEGIQLRPRLRPLLLHRRQIRARRFFRGSGGVESFGGGRLRGLRGIELGGSRRPLTLNAFELGPELRQSLALFIRLVVLTLPLQAKRFEPVGANLQ